MKSTLDLNKELHKKLSRIKAPIVLPAGKTPGYQGACVFCREDGYHLISSSKAEGHQTLCISRSRDLTGWSAPAPLWEDEREEGQGIPGSGVFFQGNYLFCSLSKKSLHLISSQDLNEFVSLGELLLSGDHASLAKACRAGSAVSSEKTLLPEAREAACLLPPSPPALAEDTQNPKRLWCLYPDRYQGLVSAWTEDLRIWHKGGQTDVRADSVSILPPPSASAPYTIFLAKKGIIHPYTADSLERLSLTPISGSRDIRPCRSRCLEAGSVFYDASMGLYQMYYGTDASGSGTEHDAPADSQLTGNSESPSSQSPGLPRSIALAVSPDLTHWQFFTRDKATFPDNGIVYDGDYYKAIPFGQYITDQPLPQDVPVFDIRHYGAVGDGATLCTEAFRAAAEAARDAGGGMILVSGGYYCTGTVRLYSNTTLWIERDSALCASKDLSLYEDALVKSVDAENISIQGGGKIIGNGEYFVYLPLKRPLTEPLFATKLPPRLYDPMGYPVDTIRYAYRCRIRYAEDRYGEGLAPIQRPMYTVWIRGCHNAEIKNIVIEDALDWTLVLDCSEQVTVQDIVINGNRHVANTDGIDIMGSRRVTIRHCFVSCADDGICIKSPLRQGHDGINVAEADSPMSGAQDIHISDCTVVSVMNAFKIGTETYFDISNVTVENCRFMMPDIYPGSVSGISIESADGSHISHIRIRDIEMDRVCCPVFICLNMRNKYGFTSEEDKQARQYGGSIRDISIEDVCAWQVEVPSIITGFQTEKDGMIVERQVENIRINRFQAVYRDNIEELSPEKQVYENIIDYPENNAFGDVPACGFYIRHARQAELADCHIIPRTSNKRPCIVMDQQTPDN